MFYRAEYVKSKQQTQAEQVQIMPKYPIECSIHSAYQTL